ncbi:hypothetical protein M758_3G254100 [Ceratodon purpureus]|nr:hypothetical protein M758_3G254100 [Ceratodon purpureus]KAG0624525.1 hypothetical protein M758_3G254100 [Ceratodon purpureus]KAG0624528.1 hypothetical protein M758_3G254100 [Ceratodon purpureus]
MAQLCIGWLFSSSESVKGDSQRSADELVRLCKGTIARLVQRLSEHYLMNKDQCVVLAKKLSETQDTLAFLLRSSISDERKSPALQELHKVVLKAEALIHSSCIPGSQWLRAAIEQRDMKESFSKLIYEAQWHTIVLQSILMDNPMESHSAFTVALCNGRLYPMDDFSLRIAMREDETVLKDRLSSVKLDDSIHQGLAHQLLKQMVVEDIVQVPSATSENPYQHKQARKQTALVGKDASRDDKSVTSPLKLFFLNPQDLKKYLGGVLLGRGAFAEVRKLNLLGGKFAIKSFNLLHANESFEDEIAALQRLGHHPNIVSLFGYSRNNEEFFLIMEEMDMDLSKYMKLRRVNDDKRSDIETVALMLQIADGVRFIHSKGLVHGNLKSSKVLVSLTDPSGRSSSRISSAKISDSGLTKIKEASLLHSNQTSKTGNAEWTAPEVITTDQGDIERAKFNSRFKADVYNFAFICSELLSEEDHYRELQSSETKKKVEASDISKLRPNLSENCPLRLASLIRSCWAEDSTARPEFSEICQELRYIKGLLLRGDQQMLQTKFISNTIEQVPRENGTSDKEGKQSSHVASPKDIIRQGPWGREEPHKKTGLFDHAADSIKWMRLKYQQSPPGVGFLEVGYVEPDGQEFTEAYCKNIIGTTWRTIKFEPEEYIRQVSGSVGPHEVTVSDSRGKVDLYCVVSLTIHTNQRSYGPFGDENVGNRFRSGTGTVTGFFGASGVLLDKLGIWLIPDGEDAGDQSFLIEQ